MEQGSRGRRFVSLIGVCVAAAVIELAVAPIAVGALGLWVAVGAITGLGATALCGGLDQVLVATDYDAVLNRAAATDPKP